MFKAPAIVCKSFAKTLMSSTHALADSATNLSSPSVMSAPANLALVDFGSCLSTVFCTASWVANGWDKSTCCSGASVLTFMFVASSMGA